MAIGNPVSYWYGTKAQYNTLSLHLADTLYFITDEQTIYKGDVRFAEGVEQLSAVDSSAPASPAKYDKYFNTDDGKIYVYDGTSWGNEYYPAEGNMYYDKNAKRFVYFVPTYDGTTVTGGSMSDVYDAGVSGDSTQGVSVQGTSTVTVANASVNGKGVVQIGDNINVTNAGVISVSVANASTFGLVKTGDNITNTNGVISVGKATASSLGVVKPGDNINVDNNGQLSVPVADDSTLGVVKAGDNINNTSGTLSVPVASTSTKGVVKVAAPFSVADGTLNIADTTTTSKGAVQVGTNIDVADGVISVKDASTSDKGVVQLVDSTSDTTSTDKTVTPNYVKTIADTKQDNLTFDTTTGIEVISGTTVKNDIATVEEVLTGATGTNIVDADNLKGALSVGQAVDVSCPAIDTSFTTISYNDQAITMNEYASTYYLNDLVFTRPDSSAGAQHYLGFGFLGGASHLFPKFASGLAYLFIMDVENQSTSTLTSISLYAPDVNSVNFLTRAYTNVQPNAKFRIALLTKTATAYFVARNSVAGILKVKISNWRQYEVTALTDEAIAYLAQLPDPDAFFRSTSAYSIRNKYLIKQDMVCPFIPTINMPDNSDLTVAAGLSYKIKYTNNNPHTITADTIPSDAYGWDTHIQMFIKGTSAINFQAPLVLMDALTPNAGHNMVVKWRNGDALVYVDDTNAGNIVISTSGTTAGTLNYYLQQDPGTGRENYIIFGAITDGETCDADSVAVNYNTNIVGNGTDKTAITGNISATSGKTINFQSLTIDGSTLGGVGEIYLDSVTINGTCTFNSSVTSIPPIYCRSVTIGENSTLVCNQKKLFMRAGQSSVINGVSNSVLSLGSQESPSYLEANLASSVELSNLIITGYASDANLGLIRGGNFPMTLSNCYIENKNNKPCILSVKDITNCTVLRVSNAVVGNYGTVLVWLNNAVANVTNSFIGFSDELTHTEKSVIAVGTNTTINITGSTLYGAVCVFGDAYGDCFFNFIGNNSYWYSGISLNSKTHISIANDAIMDVSKQAYNRVWQVKSNKNISIGDNVTFIGSDGVTFYIDACKVGELCKNGELLGSANGDNIVISGSTMNPWRATNVIFEVPLDATEADTIKLTGTTFTATAKTLNASRIQLPASTTVSFQGNTNDADTKILDAGLIVVGDNPASPSGSATVQYVTGTTTLSGIGTYIDKEGDNDFVANNTTNVKAVDASTTGAKYLGTVLSATTGETGANRFAKIDSGAVAVVNEATNAVNKNIITHDYEPIIGGTFSLTSATVNDATKTVAIQSGGTMSVVDIRGGKDSVIDLGGTNVLNSGNASASGVVFSGGSASTLGGAVYNYNGATANYTSCTFANNRANNGAGVAVNNSATSVTFIDCTISGNTAINFGGGLYCNASATTKLTGCRVTANKCNYGGGLFVSAGAKVELASCDVSGNTTNDIYIGSGGSVTLKDSNTVGLVTGVSGVFTLTSGAIINLTSSIAPGGGITVLTGGCTVNGNVIPAGTYTSIDSNGQPTQI